MGQIFFFFFHRVIGNATAESTFICVLNNNIFFRAPPITFVILVSHGYCHSILCTWIRRVVIRHIIQYTIKTVDVLSKCLNPRYSLIATRNTKHNTIRLVNIINYYYTYRIDTVI